MPEPADNGMSRWCQPCRENRPYQGLGEEKCCRNGTRPGISDGRSVHADRRECFQ